MSIQEEYADEALWDVPLFLDANKNASWKESIMLKTESIVEFFEKNNLFKTNILEKHTKNPETLLITLGDLTEEAFEFTEKYFDKWQDNTDRWKTTPTKEKYIESLSKLYEKHKK